MRALFVCLPGVGHVRPMLPLARAMRSAGHDVVFATGRDFRPPVIAAGFPFEQAGPTRSEAKAERLRRHPESTGVDPTEQQRFHVRKVWGGIYAPAMLDDLLAVTARRPPDLIVHDAMAFAAPLAAATLGVPAVSHSTGPGFARPLLDEATTEVAPLWRRHGLTPPRAAGVYDLLHVDVWPEVLQLADVGHQGDLLRVSTVDDEPTPGERMPDWYADLPDRPTVHLTLGTVFNSVEVLRSVVSALRDEHINLLVAVGPGLHPDELGPQPGNVRVEPWLPHARFLESCAVVVAHGGAGTTLKSLGHGIPLLLLPQGADMFRTARACVGHGLARSLAPDQLRPDLIRAEVRRLLDDDRYRQQCLAVSKEIADLPPPAAVVPHLERLANR